MKSVAMIFAILCIATNSATAWGQASPTSVWRAKPTMEERLIRVEEGVKNLEKRLDAVEASLNKRIDGLETSLNKRIDDLRADMTSRLDALMLWMQILSGILALLFASVFGTLLMMWKKVVTVEANVAQQMKIMSEQLNLLKSKTA